MAKIILKCTEFDEDVYEYEIIYDEIRIMVNFNLVIESNTLYLNKLNIQGDRANIFGTEFKKVVREIAREFCSLYGINKIEISGTKRTSGLSKGKIPTAFKFDFDKLQ